MQRCFCENLDLMRNCIVFGHYCVFLRKVESFMQKLDLFVDISIGIFNCTKYCVTSIKYDLVYFIYDDHVNIRRSIVIVLESYLARPPYDERVR